ncbi:MAG: LysM peptidoglycan-binding domain-containing protein, partial [Opitutaceae bacterium]
MSRFRSFYPLVLGLGLILAGCARNDEYSPAMETDDPAYQRGKSLEKQGRDQEALGVFLKIIAKRGEDAPESQIEAALLYQEHVKDPVSAIYHFKKYLELRPNSPKADLVRQQIAACMREFARTLPGQPLGGQAAWPDLTEVVDRLQKENDALKSELAAARANQAAPAATPASLPTEPRLPPETRRPSAQAQAEPESEPETDSGPSPSSNAQPIITRAPFNAGPPAAAPVRAPLGRHGLSPAPVAAGRVHMVAKGDTLMNISQRYYGTRSKWRDIYAANHDVMKSENDLKIGMQLKI